MAAFGHDSGAHAAYDAGGRRVAIVLEPAATNRGVRLRVRRVFLPGLRKADRARAPVAIVLYPWAGNAERGSRDQPTLDTAPAPVGAAVDGPVVPRWLPSPLMAATVGEDQ